MISSKFLVSMIKKTQFEIAIFLENVVDSSEYFTPIWWYSANKETPSGAESFKCNLMQKK